MNAAQLHRRRKPRFPLPIDPNVIELLAMFNNSAGQTKVYDLSGNGNDGDITGALWGENSLIMDGDDNANFGAIASKGKANAFSGFIRFKVTAEASGYLMGNQDVAGASPWGWALFINNASYLELSMKYNAVNKHLTRHTAPVGAVTGEVITVAFSYDGNNGVDGSAKLYVDGVVTAGNTYLGDNFASNDFLTANDFKIGDNMAAQLEAFAVVVNRVLTAEEIKALHEYSMRSVG